jgi:hypothetical protein
MTRTAALGVLVLAPALVHAQAAGWAEKLFIHDGAPRTTHDFGVVPRGAVLSHRFVFKNIYDVPMTVMSTRTSCGCVTVQAPQQPVPKLGMATIDVTMDARRFTGAKSVSIYVTVGQPPQFHSTAVLTVSANSRADVVFNPGAVNFGVVPLGQTPTAAIAVEYAGQLDWRITGVSTDAPLKVTHQETYRKQGGAGYQLNVTLLPEVKPGPHKWEVVLQTNDPATPTVTALVEATVQSPLSALPNAVALQASVGGTVKRNVVLQGSGKPFRVTGVEGDGNGVIVELPSDARPVHVVVITFQPTAAGAARRQLTFRTDLDSQSAVTVTVDTDAKP